MWIHVIKNNIFMLKYAFKYAKFSLFQRFIYSVLSVVPALVNVLLIKIPTEMSLRTRTKNQLQSNYTTIS